MNVARKIGYSLLGLLAGDGALLTYFVLIAKPWVEHPGLVGLIEFYAIFTLIFSLIGWILAGIPLVLLLPTRSIVRLHWLLVALIGLAIGAFAQSLIFLGLGLTGHLNLAGHWRDVLMYGELAMIVSTVAFAVYCALARRTPPIQ